VRKALELNDTTYYNEVRILSMLQSLKHPNILKLVACYTHNSKHNLISPYVAGGTLQNFLQQDRPVEQSCEKIFCSMAGLASAIYRCMSSLSETLSLPIRDTIKT
jgi:serine/threonine protein kinase